MVLASTAPFAAVRRAREVTEAFEGVPVEGSRLDFRKKRETISTSNKHFKKWQTNVMYLIPVQKLPRLKCQLPFSEIQQRLELLIHLHFLLRESDR